MRTTLRGVIPSRFPILVPRFPSGTGCITWFSELENDVENANKTTNPIGIFTAWNIVMVI